MPWLRRRHPTTSIDIRITFGEPTAPAPPQTQHVSLEPGNRVVISTDLMFAAWRQLFPPERMVVFGGRSTQSGVSVTSLWDVTEPRPSSGHVRAAADKLGVALVDFERTDTHLAVWLHSHPGEGLRATHPSITDRNQDRDLRLNYSQRLVGAIAVRDGWLRLWGEAIDRGQAQVEWLGRGIEPVTGEPNVFRLSLT